MMRDGWSGECLTIRNLCTRMQSLLHMAEAEMEAEAKIPDAGATSRPPLRDIVDGLGRSLPQDPPGLYTSDNPPPSMPMAPPPPKSRSTPRNPVPSALAAPRARDANISPRPSAPPLELLMEDGFLDGG